MNQLVEFSEFEDFEFCSIELSIQGVIKNYIVTRFLVSSERQVGCKFTSEPGTRISITQSCGLSLVPKLNRLSTTTPVIMSLSEALKKIYHTQTERGWDNKQSKGL